VQASPVLNVEGPEFENTTISEASRLIQAAFCCFGALGAKKIQNALKRILGKVKQQHFNSLEVTGIVAKRFLGVPYAVVSAHSRHLQQRCYLESAEGPSTTQNGPEAEGVSGSGSGLMKPNENRKV